MNALHIRLKRHGGAPPRLCTESSGLGLQESYIVDCVAGGKVWERLGTLAGK